MARMCFVIALIVLSGFMAFGEEERKRYILPMYWTAVLIYWIFGLLEVLQ